MKREIHKFIKSLLNILHVIMFSESQRIWIVIHWFDGNVTGDAYLKCCRMLFGLLFGGRKAFGFSKMGPECTQLMMTLIFYRKNSMDE